MSSICGISDFLNSENINFSLCEKMCNTMSKRGPDGNNSYINSFSVISHNRLDSMVEKKGIQPFCKVFRGKHYSACYNGEIYNKDELISEIKKNNITLETKCDTEVLICLYILYGEDAPSHINGVFSLVIADEDENKLFFARDRFGIKPFFYSLKDTTFLFASEIKALLAHPFVSSSVDYEGLWQLLYLSPGRLEGSAVFKDISELKPGFCGCFSENGLILKNYWSLKAKAFDESESDAISHTKFLLKDAVKRQLENDIPLCAFLSGGLDSSAVTAIASEEFSSLGKKLETYSFEYEDNKNSFTKSLFQPQSDDEFAVYTSNYLETSHTVLTAPTALVASNLYNAVLCRDLPGQADIDSSLYYYCRQVKRKHKIALSGECSDEIFGGYPWYYRPEMLENDFFPWIHDPFFRINLFNESIVKKDEGFSFMKEAYKKALDSTSYLDSDSPEDILARKATTLSVKFFMTSLLERKDRIAMSSSLEARVPFADHRLAEYIYNVPWKIKYKDNVEKALLRNAMEGLLPDSVRLRKKSPYPKTHSPVYEDTVISMLKARLKKGGILTELINPDTLSSLIYGENSTWFGQLMGKPQLIAWLVQFDYWFEYYNVNLLI